MLLDHLVAPESPEQRDHGIGALAAIVEAATHRDELVLQPADSDTERDPAVGEAVEGDGRARHLDGMAQREDVDVGGEANGAGGMGDVRQRHPHVEQRSVRAHRRVARLAVEVGGRDRTRARGPRTPHGARSRRRSEGSRRRGADRTSWKTSWSLSLAVDAMSSRCRVGRRRDTNRGNLIR